LLCYSHTLYIPDRCCKLLQAPVCVQRIYDAILVLVPEVTVLLQNCSVRWVVAA